ncbi:MAG: cyanophycin synthetase, partial [Burkholderiales bacterium]
AVLNAADARVADMAKFCDGEVIYYSPSPEAPPLAAHLSAGGRAVILREGKVVLARGSAETALIDAASLPAGEHSMLAGIAVAWALNLAPELIRAGLESFDTAGA